MGSLVGETFSYVWNQSGDKDDMTLLKATIRGVHITVIEVAESAMVDESATYEVIELVDEQRLSLIISVPSGYLQFIEDEVDDRTQAAMAIGAFLGHICTESANNLLGYDWEDEE